MFEEQPPSEELIARNQDLEEKLAASEQELRELHTQHEVLRNEHHDLDLKLTQVLQAKKEVADKAAEMRASNEREREAHRRLEAEIASLKAEIAAASGNNDKFAIDDF